MVQLWAAWCATAAVAGLVSGGVWARLEPADTSGSLAMRGLTPPAPTATASEPSRTEEQLPERPAETGRTRQPPTTAPSSTPTAPATGSPSPTRVADGAATPPPVDETTEPPEETEPPPADETSEPPPDPEPPPPSVTGRPPASLPTG